MAFLLFYMFLMLLLLHNELLLGSSIFKCFNVDICFNKITLCAESCIFNLVSRSHPIVVIYCTALVIAFAFVVQSLFGSL